MPNGELVESYHDVRYVISDGELFELRVGDVSSEMDLYVVDADTLDITSAIDYTETPPEPLQFAFFRPSVLYLLDTGIERVLSDDGRAVSA